MEHKNFEREIPEGYELSKYIELLPYGQRSAEENIIKNTVYFGMPKRISFLERNSE